MPPHLVPGRSAKGWAGLELLALLSLVISVISWLWLSVYPEVVLLAVAALPFYIWTLRGYRRAAYRERHAGYTTIFGDRADISLPSKGMTPVIPLFSTRDLWQLDPKTGAVVRRPGEPPPTRGNGRQFEDR